MEQFPTLYKRTSTGAIQTWFMEVEDDKYRSTSGQLYGKLTTTEWTVCEPKNVGKKNERSGAQQAVAKVESIYKKKRRTDYFDNVDDVDNVTRTKPMLATALDKLDLEDDQPVLIQPKFDGFRCVARKDGLFTREGLPINTVPHISRALSAFFELYPDVILDGELYNHKYCDNFNKISSILRNESPTAEEAALAAEMFYVTYDVPSSKQPQDQRLSLLKEYNGKIDHKMVTVADTRPATVADIPELLEQALKRKYEGVIARIPTALYANKRSKDLIKVKKILEEDFTIVRIEEGVGNGAGKARRVVMQTEDRTEFSVGVIGDDDYATSLFESRDNFRGQRGSVKFLNLTPRGVPRGGKLKSVRWG